MSPTSLNELFNKAPLILTDEEVDRIVVALEKERQDFVMKEAAPKAAPKAKKVAADLNLKLDDLDL